MAFAEIVFEGTNKPSKIPDMGLLIRARKLNVRRGGNEREVAYLQMAIGAGLAAKVLMRDESHNLRMLLGSGEDAGKVLVAVDLKLGKFLAKRDKKGNYYVSVNAATAGKIFELEFPLHTCESVDIQVRGGGLPPSFIFEASPEMLKKVNG